MYMCHAQIMHNHTQLTEKAKGRALCHQEYPIPGILPRMPSPYPGPDSHRFSYCRRHPAHLEARQAKRHAQAGYPTTGSLVASDGADRAVVALFSLQRPDPGPVCRCCRGLAVGLRTELMPRWGAGRAHTRTKEPIRDNVTRSGEGPPAWEGTRTGCRVSGNRWRG